MKRRATQVALGHDVRPWLDQRKLVAVFAAEGGYSRLMGADEVGTFGLTEWQTCRHFHQQQGCQRPARSLSPSRPYCST